MAMKVAAVWHIRDVVLFGTDVSEETAVSIIKVRKCSHY